MNTVTCTMVKFGGNFDSVNITEIFTYLSCINGKIISLIQTHVRFIVIFLTNFPDNKIP